MSLLSEVECSEIFDPDRLPIIALDRNNRIKYEKPGTFSLKDGSGSENST